MRFENKSFDEVAMLVGLHRQRQQNAGHKCRAAVVALNDIFDSATTEIDV